MDLASVRLDPHGRRKRLQAGRLDLASGRVDLRSERLKTVRIWFVKNCTSLVRNYLTGRLDLHEFGKELPYRKAGSARNCTNLYEFGKELPYRKTGSA